MNKFFVFFGIAILLIGIFWPHLGKLGSVLWNLPGNFSFKRGNFSFYFPLGLCVFISVVLTLLFSIFRK